MTLIGDLIRVNVEVTTRLTRLVIPGMLKKRRGAIVNVGSGAATVLPSDPLYAVYAGTKGCVLGLIEIHDLEDYISLLCRHPWHLFPSALGSFLLPTSSASQTSRFLKRFLALGTNCVLNQVHVDIR